jgi:exosome complex component RRP42
MARIGDLLIVDPTSEEEAAMDARITLTTDDDGNICAGQKGEPSTFYPAKILEAADTSIRIGREIRNAIWEASK